MGPVKISILGTCRIHDPINAANKEGKISIATPSDTSYIHTSAEAIQRIEHHYGNYSYPPELSQFQVGSRETNLKNGFNIRDCEIVLVEISSIKLLSVGEHYIQFNHTVNRIKRTDSSFAEKWLPLMDKSFSSGTQIPDNIDIPTTISETEREIISKIETRKQSFSELKKDLKKIHQILGDKVIFVTHVAASKNNGQPILSRERLIKEIVDFCAENKLPVIDPSIILHKIGQEKMMAKEGLDTNHYSQEALNDIGSEFINLILKYTG